MSWSIAQQVLGCGSLDLPYLDNLIDSFDVDLEDYDLRQAIQETDRPFNWIVNLVFTQALADADIDYNSDFWESKIEIYTNYIDSHLSMNNDGDWVGIQDITELIEYRDIILENNNLSIALEPLEND
tara:strand:+ start:2476 stop:2856 length:381 start_codon:yes stop_codon:yes gene_type:complete